MPAPTTTTGSADATPAVRGRRRVAQAPSATPAAAADEACRKARRLAGRFVPALHGLRRRPGPCAACSGRDAATGARARTAVCGAPCLLDLGRERESVAISRAERERRSRLRYNGIREPCRRRTRSGIDEGPSRIGGADRRRRLHERSTGPRRHAQGRVRPHLRRHAAELERRRPALRGLGDLPRQGLAGRSRTASTPRRPAAGSGRSSSAPTTAARPGTSPARRPASRPPRRTAYPRARATSSSTTPRPRPASRSPRTSGTTARSTPGSSSASGTSSPR